MTHILSLRFSAAAATCLALFLTSRLGAQIQSAPLDARPSEAAFILPEAPAPQSAPAAGPSDPTLPEPASSSGTQPVPGAEPAIPAPVPVPLTESQIREQRRAEAERELQTEEKQRLLGVMPQFQTVIGGKAVPLSGGQKWKLASRSAIDLFYIEYAFIVGGGYSELVDSHSGYHWGPAGYFKRVGANYADNINGALIGNGLLPIALHQDPRYFRLGTGSFGRRFLHAAISTIVCKGDNGKNQPNVSNVVGNFISGAISNAYYPADERGVKLTLENGLQVTALGAVGGQLLEFGPDLNRLILHHHKKIIPRIPIAPAPADTTPPGPPSAPHD